MGSISDPSQLKEKFDTSNGQIDRRNSKKIP